MINQIDECFKSRGSSGYRGMGTCGLCACTDWKRARWGQRSLFFMDKRFGNNLGGDQILEWIVVLVQFRVKRPHWFTLQSTLTHTHTRLVPLKTTPAVCVELWTQPSPHILPSLLPPCQTCTVGLKLLFWHQIWICYRLYKASRFVPRSNFSPLWPLGLYCPMRGPIWSVHVHQEAP